MKQALEDTVNIRRYLLGEATEEEQRRVEERLMTEEEYFRQVQLMEDELTEDYVRATLSADDHARFETHFMAAPEQRESVQYAGALRRYFSEERDPVLEDLAGVRSKPMPWWRSGFLAFMRPPRLVAGVSLASAAAILAVSIGVVWMMYRAGGSRIEQDP